MRDALSGVDDEVLTIEDLTHVGYIKIGEEEQIKQKYKSKKFL